MTEEPVRQREVALGVQGCLFAAVALFVVLLIGLLLIGYLQFRAPPVDPPPQRPLGPSTLVTPAAEPDAAPRSGRLGGRDAPLRRHA